MLEGNFGGSDFWVEMGLNMKFLELNFCIEHDSLMKKDPFFSNSGFGKLVLFTGVDDMFKSSFERANTMMSKMMSNATSMFE